MSHPSLRIGTRGSRLALAQAQRVAEALQSLDPRIEIHFVSIQTDGDRFAHTPLVDLGGKGLFVKAIEQALLENHVDIAVHSLKDMETQSVPGITLTAVLKRDDPRDVWIAKTRGSPDAIHKGAVVGTCSPRRALQLKLLRPDLHIVPLRGNVDTRLKRLQEDGLDAIILAAAALERLNLSVEATFFDPYVFIPAVGQGVIAVQTRTSDKTLTAQIHQLDHTPTRQCITVERDMLHHLGGTCKTPIAGFAQIQSDTIHLQALYAPEGNEPVAQGILTSPIGEASMLGHRMAHYLKNKIEESWR